MKSNQEVICALRKLINQINDTSDIDLIHRLVDEFLEKYEIWPCLQKIILSFICMRKRDKGDFLVFEKKSQRQIERRYKSFILECKKQNITVPKSIIDTYEQREISSDGFIKSRFEAVKQLIFLLNDNGHKKKIKKFVKFTEDEKGILECNFSSAYLEYEQKKNELKETSWYCFDQLVRFKKTKAGFDEDILFFDKAHYLRLRELQYLMLYGEKINIDGYKPLVKNLFEYTKEHLLQEKHLTDNEEFFTYKYMDKNGERKGEISDGKKTHSLVGKSAELVYVLNKKKRISKEDAGDLVSDTDLVEKKEQVNNAIRVVNDGMLKTFLKSKYISSKNGIISINYQTNLLK